ncbi:hypothetical protein ACLMJK_007051 [Lecanora helva]
MVLPTFPSSAQIFLLPLLFSLPAFSRPQDSVFLLNKRSGTHVDPTVAPPPNQLQQLTDTPACAGPGNDDMSNPSQDCLNAQNVSTQGVTYLTRGCNALSVDQRNILNTAILDAKNLGIGARSSMGYKDCSYEHGCTPTDRANQAMRYYMGDDSVDNLDYRGLIYRNIDRLSHFVSQKPFDSTRIYVHCDDPKGWCNDQVEGKPIGGYAWTIKHWFWWWDYHINMCKPFYTQQNIGNVHDNVDNPRDGKETAGKLAYLQTTGSLIIHEMMHTAYVANSPPDPWIEDVNLNQGGGSRHRTYGPKDVWKLAHKRREDGGQGKLSRTNSDSYVQLINALYWWDQTDVFPGVPGRPVGSTIDNFALDAAAALIPEPPWPEFVYLGDLGGGNTESDQELWDNAIAGNPARTKGAPGP